MSEHILLPGVPLQQSYIRSEHEQYLTEWREQVIQLADRGDVAASMCHQANLIDLVLFGRPRHDWIGIMDQFLMENGTPLAYSEQYGKRLYGFGDQYKQPTIHAIHTRWWIECLNDINSVNHAKFANLVLAKKQSDGLIYDYDVSETVLRHRMKSELTMSMAMATEILSAANRLTPAISLELATNIVSPIKCPTLGYMSMEYFRLKVLQLLGYERLFPIGIEEHITACAEDLPVGWCDFSMKTKVDAYMGTAKRTQRDKPIHSPLITCYVAALVSKVEAAEKKAAILQRLNNYACYLKANPLDIPSFQMRDVPISFGADKTPIEAICASFLMAQCQNS